MNTLHFEPAIVKFELPLPPTTNHSYTPAVINGKSSFVSKIEHKQFKKDAALLLNNQRQLMNSLERDAYERAMQEIIKSNAFLFIDALFFLESILKSDQDGRLKAIQDVVCKHLGIDDKYVLDAHIGKRKAYGNSRCQVAVYLANQENAL